MSGTSSKYPYENTQIVALLRRRIDELSGTMTQREIAAAIGYDKPNNLSMIKRGEAKVPLDRLPDFARVLSLDLAVLFLAGLQQWMPNARKELTAMFAERIVTQNERAMLHLLRTYLMADDAEISLDLLERLRRGFRDL